MEECLLICGPDWITLEWNCEYYRSIIIDGHDWFQRVWTMQELLLARRAQIIVGHASIEYYTYTYLNRFLLESEQTMALYTAFKRSLKLKPERAQGPNVAALLKIITVTISRRCHDPRDKLYGSLSVLNEIGFDLAKPDYGKTAKEICEEFIISVIQHTQALSILFHVCMIGRMTEWPSWVPDITRDGLEHGGELLEWGQSPHAFRSVLGNMYFQHQPGRIVLKGKIIGKMEWVLKAPLREGNIRYVWDACDWLLRWIRSVKGANDHATACEFHSNSRPEHHIQLGIQWRRTINLPMAL